MNYMIQEKHLILSFTLEIIDELIQELCHKHLSISKVPQKCHTKRVKDH